MINSQQQVLSIATIEESKVRSVGVLSVWKHYNFTTMFTVLFGLVALSCFSLPVLGVLQDREARMYRVDITLPPKEGRDEKADILDLKTKVAGLTDIEVLFSFKELGNSMVILVLRVDKACSWPQLTSFLARKGYEVKVIPVYYCSDFARELGMNMTRDFYDSTLANDEDLLLAKQTFPVKDFTPAQYVDNLRQNFEGDINFMKGDQRAACFRTLAGVPVELTYFAPTGQSKAEITVEDLYAPNTFEVEMLRIQKLDNYTGACE